MGSLIIRCKPMIINKAYNYIEMTIKNKFYRQNFHRSRLYIFMYMSITLGVLLETGSCYPGSAHGFTSCILVGSVLRIVLLFCALCLVLFAQNIRVSGFSILYCRIGFRWRLFTEDKRCIRQGNNDETEKMMKWRKEKNKQYSTIQAVLKYNKKK